jgi:hypothetical protein
VEFKTAALAINGSPQPGAPKVLTEEYDGTTWTSGGNLANARTTASGVGTQTAGLVWGGGNGAPAQTTTEEYNGSSWTAGGNLATAKT